MKVNANPQVMDGRRGGAGALRDDHYRGLAR